MADVELAIVVQERLIYIRLKNVGLCLTVLMLFLLPNDLNHLGGLRKFNSITPVGVLSRLYDPHLPRFIFIVPQKAFVLWVFRPFHVIRFRNIIERVSLQVISIVMEE